MKQHLSLIRSPSAFLLILVCGCSDEDGAPGMASTGVTPGPGGSSSIPTTGPTTTDNGTTPSSGSSTVPSNEPSTTGTPSATASGSSTGPSTGPSVSSTASGSAPGSGGMSGTGGDGGTGGMMPGAGGAGGDTGAGGSGDMAPVIPATLATLEQVIMALGCAGADCHGGNEFNALDLRLNDELYTNLTTSVSVKCENLPIVDPGNPEGSALIKLLEGPCGEIARMPAGCFENEFENNCVPDNYIAAIEQWIAEGAPQQ